MSKAVNIAGEERCERCGRVLAKQTADGGLLLGGVPVLAIAGQCPECGFSFSLPRIGLEVTCKGIEELYRSLNFIQGSGGFGRLIIEFQRGQTSKVGIGESMRDTRE